MHRAKPSLLIADDEHSVRWPIAESFRRNGFNVVEAADGVEALRNAISQPPDAIILDYNMPRMSGVEVAQAIHARADLRHVPMILISGSGSPKLREQALDAGCVNYLPKPYSPMAMVAEVMHWLRADQTTPHSDDDAPIRAD